MVWTRNGKCAAVACLPRLVPCECQSVPDRIPESLSHAARLHHYYLLRRIPHPLMLHSIASGSVALLNKSQLDLITVMKLLTSFKYGPRSPE